MKLIAACMLLLAFAACSIHALDLAENVSLPPSVLDEETQEYMADILNDDDDDFEIVDMDDALQKYRMLKAISRIVEEAEAMDTKNPLRKRFIGSIWTSIKSAVTTATKKVGDFFTKTWSNAKYAFNAVVSNIDFSAAVNKVIPYINSGMTVNACKAAVASAASLILGPAASLVGYVSGPLCNGALAKLQEYAG